MTEVDLQVAREILQDKIKELDEKSKNIGADSEKILKDKNILESAIEILIDSI